MSTQFLLWMVTGANALVAGTTYALLGWNGAGAHAATRNTARFAGVCFLLTFAAPALVRFAKRLPSEATLVLTFVAAQGVHFAMVIVLLFGFEREHVAQNLLLTALVFIGGFGLVLTAALTSRPCRARWSGRRRRAYALASVRLSNCTCSFPACSFHEDSNFRDASEGINRTRLTSPYSPYRVRRGSCSQPALRQCLQRCDQIRQTIHRSRRLKSCRTWARL